MNIPSDKKLSQRLNHLVQQAVDKTIENHRQKGESIAISDEKGKVKIIPASDIPKFQKIGASNSKKNTLEASKEI